MRKLLTILCLMATCPIYSQSIKKLEPAILECQYDFQVIEDTISRSIKDDDIMVLRIGQSTSQFYSYYLHYSDSLLSDSKGSILWSQLTIDAINKGIPQNRPGARTTMDYIYKNYPIGYTTTYTCDGVMSYYVYKEKYESQNWAVIDSIKQILGYTCQLATCNFRGRIFFAWFTTDIPISDGPWKFSGLPGLILEAYDKTNDYHYTIKEIKQSNLRPVEMYNFKGKRYEKTDRLTFLRAQSGLYFGNRNAMAEVEAETGIKISSGAPIPSSKKRKAYDFIEKDYH